MSQTHDAIDTVPSEVDDLDVEGHGMKEVALGVGAATLLASGSGIALAAADGPLGGTVSGAGTAVTAVQQGAQSDLQEISAAAERAAQTGINAVVPIGTQAQSLVQETATTAGTTAGSAAAEAMDTATAAASDPWGTTDRAVDKAMQDYRDLRDSTTATAGSTVSSTLDTAASTAAGAQETAQQAVTQVGTDLTATQKTLQGTAEHAAKRADATVTSTSAEAQRLAAAAVETAEDLVGEDTGATVTRSGGTTTVKASAAGHTTEVKVTS